MTSKLSYMHSLKLNTKELNLLDFLLEQAQEGFSDMSDFLLALGYTQTALGELQEYIIQRRKS